jgi:transposase
MQRLSKPIPTKPERKPYPSDVSDDEWAFVAPYLTLMTPDAPQRRYDLREMFSALRWIVRAGAPWRLLPNDFPPWKAVYDQTHRQTHRWIEAGVFEDIADDLREVLRVALGKGATPSAAILDSQTMRSTPESGQRAGYDAGKKVKGTKVKGTKVHVAVDTLGCLLSPVVTPAKEQDRDQVGQLAEDIQAVTGEAVEVAFADGSYTGESAAEAAQERGIRLEVVNLPATVRGFVLLPKRWIVERSFAWKSRFRRLVRDYERLPETVAGLHFAVFAILMLARLVATTVQSA